jgi:hypothetical protein
MLVRACEFPHVLGDAAMLEVATRLLDAIPRLSTPEGFGNETAKNAAKAIRNIVAARAESLQ